MASLVSVQRIAVLPIRQASPCRSNVVAFHTQAAMQSKNLRSFMQGTALGLRRHRRCTGKGQQSQGAQASFLGVGAPEAFVVAVVALLVFGPKGLAEVAKSLGKTLAAFQPTIRELQSVSQEFQSALKEEIGLDKPLNPTPMQAPSTLEMPRQPPPPPPSAANEPNKGGSSTAE